MGSHSSAAADGAAADRDRLLGLIERRCVTMQNGAEWQAATFHRLYDEQKLDGPTPCGG
jgi:hypothetical protein